MEPMHQALGEYYSHGKSIQESSQASGVPPDQLEQKVTEINTKGIAALTGFYSTGGVLGVIAEEHGLNRNELLGFMNKYGFNADYEDPESKKRIKSLAAGTQTLQI